MLLGKRFELAYELRVTAESEIRLDPSLQAGQSSLLEPRDLGFGERLVQEVGKRRPPPELEGLAEAHSRSLWLVLLQCLPRIGGQGLKRVPVILAGTDAQDIARRLRQGTILRIEGLPQPGHRDLHGVCTTGQAAP